MRYILILFLALTVKAETIQVPVGGNLQAAINAAQPGDTIMLVADADYTCSCVLPNKSGSEYIAIKSSRYDEIPTRDFYSKTPSPEVAKLMPRIRSAYSTESVFTVAQGSHHYKILGLNLMPPSGQGTRIVELGVNGPNQDTMEEMPHHFVIDKSWLHAAPDQEMQRCLALNSSNTEITNSWLTECHGRGYDTQAIGGWNGAGNYRIVNNSLSGAGENFMLGGAPATIPNLVPTGVEFRRNYVWKPLSWYVNDPSYAGIHWTVKNLFELKNARQVVVDGNVFENNWTDAQSGRAIQFTPRPSDSGSWALIEDVQFTNNIIRNTGAGVNILGADEPPAPTETRLRRVRLANNVFDNIDGPRFGSNGSFATVTNKTEDVVIDDNTVIQTGNIIIADYLPNIRFIYRNNIHRHNEYGIIGSGHSIGNDSINYYFPGAVVAGNLIVKEVNSPSNVESIYPAGNSYPVSMAAVGFVDVAGKNYRLSPSSPYLSSGVSGSVPGADIDAIDAAMGGSGPTPTPTPTPVPTPIPSPSPSPSPSPVPTPNPPTCSISAPAILQVPRRSSRPLTVFLDGFSAPVEVATLVSSGQVGVQPVTRVATGTSALLGYMISLKQNAGTVTFRSRCGDAVVRVVPQ